MGELPQKTDPIRKAYYAPLEDAERWEARLFVVGAVLSFAVLFIDRRDHADLYNAIQITFVLVVVALFVIGHAIRLHFYPRAEGRRREDLLANSFSAVIAHEMTVGYYNNNQREPIRRLAANVLESSFFSKEVAADMLKPERLKIAAYLSAWLALAAYQRWDLALTATLAQALFSEQILSKWLRLEWLARRFETSYAQLAQLLEPQHADEAVAQRRVLEAVVSYESSKAAAALLLDSKVFERRRNALNEEWDGIRTRLRL
jgi:hypothetical protein